jgi:hypothetical protein
LLGNRVGENEAMTKGFQEAASAASQLEDILNGAWNSKLGQLDLSKVNNGIKQT